MIFVFSSVMTKNEMKTIVIVLMAVGSRGDCPPVSNKKILSNYSRNLQIKMDNGTLMWNLLGKSCVCYTAKALWAVGVPNLGGIHPYWLQLQMAIRQIGIESSPYLYQTK